MKKGQTPPATRTRLHASLVVAAAVGAIAGSAWAEPGTVVTSDAGRVSADVQRDQKACDGGDMQACYSLAQAYVSGTDDRESPKADEARQLYYKACGLGHTDACYLTWGWETWPSTTTRFEGRDGALPVKSVVWKDAGGRPWRMEWTGNRFQVQAPTSRRAIGRGAPASNCEDPETTSEPEVYRWSREGWECFVIQWDQRGVDMGRLVFWAIAVDSATGGWVLRRGRHWWEGPPSLVAIPQGLRFDWEDESEDDEPFLNSEYRWEVRRNASSLTVHAVPTRYRVVVFHPVLGNIRAAMCSPNRLEAIHAGWRSLSWRLESAGPGGGRATSHRAVLPEFREEQAAALRDLVGRWPLLALPPKNGQEEFRWEREVLLYLKGKRPVSISAERAARLASSGSWGVVLVRSGAGPCEAERLVEGAPEEQ